jgi:hypothetical protein
VYDLNEKQAIPENIDIIRFIHAHKKIRELLTDDVHLSDTENIDETKMAQEINLVVEKLNKKHTNYVLSLAIDGLDEYISSLEMNQAEIELIMKKLLGTSRFVLDSFNRICVIFSLEENTYSKLYDIISEDQTFRRRFIIPHDLNGLPVKLEPLK